jgi:hypothetical protein
MSKILGAPYTALTYSFSANFVENVGAIGDFNGDGNADYLAAYSAFDSQGHVADVNAPLNLFLGNGAGGFVNGTAAVLGRVDGFDQDEGTSEGDERGVVPRCFLAP